MWRDIDIILGSMGRSYLVDSTRDPRLTAATASSQLDMDYGHTVLDDGEPWAMLYDDQGRYATAPALDEL
ncbi:MAG: hypothetical protein SVU88_00895 [Candidatus Nanohaloarchaea archaeon]|nr:hypothetical protein [Candidatus Nanohaloarchaea archaeon]